VTDQRLYFKQLRNIWYGMIHRTTNVNHKRFADYGGRGIFVCDEWHSFDVFYEDMAKGYSLGLEIERVDNNEGYSLANCRWATVKEQANNRRTNTFFTINGATKTLAQWCETVNIKPSTVRQRLYVYKWSVKRALGLE